MPARHSSHTGAAVHRTSGAEQTRQSSGNRRERRLRGNPSARRRNPGVATGISLLLEKAHLRHTSNQALVLQFLAGNAVPRPGHGVQTLELHGAAAMLALPEPSLFDAG